MQFVLLGSQDCFEIKTLSLDRKSYRKDQHALGEY
ncbi:hypothetical protein Glaag_2176 [Glaciecola sp. 4H-3-7+YE-5]|nr:hypothetical protein Glaag_2176 [Glaciecola sp. 4H-3-7+YE-5]